MNIINVAQGEFVILGGYVTYTLYDQFGINPLWTVPIALEFADIGYVLVSGELALADAGDKLLDNPEVGRLFLGG